MEGAKKEFYAPTMRLTSHCKLQSTRGSFLCLKIIPPLKFANDENQLGLWPCPRKTNCMINLYELYNDIVPIISN